MKRFVFLLTLCVMQAALMLSPVRGQILWDNSKGSNWSTPGNWQGGVKPTAANDARLNAATTNVLPSLTTTESVKSLRIDNGQTDYNLVGSGNLKIASGGLTLLGGGSTSFAPTLTFEASQGMNLGDTNLTLAKLVIGSMAANATASRTGLAGDLGSLTITNLNFAHANSTFAVTGSGKATNTVNAITGTGKIQSNLATLIVNADATNTPITLGGGTNSTLGGNGIIGALTLTGSNEINPGLVGQTGNLTFASGLALNNSTTLHIDIASASDFDQLKMGSLQLFGAGSASLELNLLGGYSPTNGTSFLIVDGDALTLAQSFATLPDGSTFMQAGQAWAIAYGSQGVTVTAIPEPLGSAMVLATCAGVLLWGIYRNNKSKARGR